MVRWLYDPDYRKFVESRNPCVSLPGSLPLFSRGRNSDISLFLEDLGFVAFDTFKSFLQDQDGKISGPRTVMAGFGAGVTESLLAVTPFESIKTQLYVCYSALLRGYTCADGIPKESTTRSLPIPVCAVSSTEVKSYFKKEASAAFSRDSFLPRRARQQTLRRGLGAIQPSGNSHRDTLHLVRSWGQLVPSPSAEWQV